VKGMQLSWEYYITYGGQMLQEEFPELMDRIAVGLIGSGSECFGYDDEISTDHDFEPGFGIFIPGEDVMDTKTAFQLERAYAKLPKEYKGYERSLVNPVGGMRHGVIRTDEYLMSRLGNKTGELSIKEWLTVPENSILEVINGEIFYDGYGQLTKVREMLKTMPEDICRKKLAGQLLTMAQAGQYNFYRSVKRGDSGAAQLSVYEFVKSGMHAVYLLNRKYMPYYKWAFRGMQNLEILSGLAEPFEYLISTANDEREAGKKSNTIEEAAGAVIAELKKQELSEADCCDLEKHAYSVNDSIKDTDLRYLNIFAGA